MKTNTIYKAMTLFMFLTLQQVFVFGQNNAVNRYDIFTEDNKKYTFEIIENIDFYWIKYLNNSTYKTNDSITVSSIDDINNLTCAIKKIVNKGMASKDSVYTFNAKEIAQQLYSNYKLRKNGNQINSDKGVCVGILSLKDNPVAAYLIPTRSFIKRQLKEKYTNKGLCNNKKEVNKELSLYDRAYNLSLTANPVVSINSLKIRELCAKNNDSTYLKNEFGKSHIVNINDTLYLNKKLYAFCYDSIRNPTKKISLYIDSVDIAFENGIIKDMLVRTKIKNQKINYYFTNPRYISIRNAQDIDLLSSKNNNYLTFRYNRDSVFILDLAEIIDYNRKIPFASGTFIPKDTTISLSPKNNAKVNLYKPSMSESFDIRLFTDVLGYGNTSPNGIIQTEAQLNFDLNEGRNNYRLLQIYKTGFHNEYRNQWVWFNKISPFINLMKIEKTNKPLSIDSLKSTNLLELYKYANLNIGTKLNILTYRTDSKLWTYNIILGVFRTTIGNDSVQSRNITYSTIYFSPLDIDLKFFESNKIDYSLHFGTCFGWVNPTYESIATKKMLSKVSDYFLDSTNWFGQIQQNINLHPGGNKQNSVFIRTSEYLSSNNNYFTFQIGYSTILSNILKL